MRRGGEVKKSSVLNTFQSRKVGEERKLCVCVSRYVCVYIRFSQFLSHIIDDDDAFSLIETLIRTYVT